MSYIPYLCKFNSFTWTDRVLCQLTSPVIPFSAEMLQSLYVIHSTNKLPTSYSRMCVLSQSVSRLRLFVTPCTATCQAPLSRQEYWSGLPWPPSGDCPNPGIKPRSSALQADSLRSEPARKPKSTGVGSLSLLQGIFPTLGIKSGSPALQAGSLPAELPGKPPLTTRIISDFSFCCDQESLAFHKF